MRKIILADDEKLILDSISKYISAFLPDFEICGQFYDGEDALQFILEHPVDIVVTDICMPNMDGLELAREICNRMPHCITIIISGYSEFEYARTAIKYNVFNYLLKPLDFKELKKCLLEADKLAADRKPPESMKPDLQYEETELFFTDLLMGIIYSDAELERRFSLLNFPFSLKNSAGNMIRFQMDPKDISAHFTYSIDQLEISLKNILLLSFPDLPVYFVRRTEASFYYIVIDGSFAEKMQSTPLNETIRELLKISCSIDVYQSFSGLKYLLHNRAPLSGAVQTCRPAADDDLIQKAISFIEQNYEKDLNREMVADTIYMSPSYFSYQFKKKTGTSFFDYLTNVRMQKAVELLGTRMKVSDIALKVGYQSRNRFFINFRQYTSYTPTEYRRKILCMGEISNEENS